MDTHRPRAGPDPRRRDVGQCPRANGRRRKRREAGARRGRGEGRQLCGGDVCASDRHGAGHKHLPVVRDRHGERPDVPSLAAERVRGACGERGRGRGEKRDRGDEQEAAGHTPRVAVR